jgi:hypothetical protein
VIVIKLRLQGLDDQHGGLIGRRTRARCGDRPASRVAGGGQILTRQGFARLQLEGGFVKGRGLDLVDAPWRIGKEHLATSGDRLARVLGVAV